MKEYLKIGEMAELTHVSTQTLRLYARNGLLVPEYLDEQTGYRYYTLEQCAILDLIHALKSCDMSLLEIKELLSAQNTDVLADILQVKSTALDSEINSLLISRSNLERIIKNLRLLNALPPAGLPFFEYEDERTIDAQQTNNDFFSEGADGYEKMVRHMQNYMFENSIPPTYFMNIGTLIDKDNFIKEEFASTKAFVFADEMYPARTNLEKLPQGLYLSIISDHIDKEIEYAGNLHREIERQSLEVVGDYVCEVLSRFPFNRSSELYFKIQVPVIRKRMI